MRVRCAIELARARRIPGSELTVVGWMDMFSFTVELVDQLVASARSTVTRHLVQKPYRRYTLRL